jgi:hypothetical protein
MDNGRKEKAGDTIPDVVVQMRAPNRQQSTTE